MFLLQSFTSCFIISFEKQRVWEIIHPSRRNLTTIRGYVRLGGLPDNPRTDPQDRSWFGPHDRLFTEEESDPLEFSPGPDYGTFTPPPLTHSLTPFLFTILDWNEIKCLVWCWGWDGAGDLDGPDVDPIWEHMNNKSTRPDSVKVRHHRDLRL